MPLELDPRPEAGFRSALDPGALCSGTMRLMIQHETGLHCGPTLSTCRFAVFHGVTSDEDPKLVRGLTSELDANPFPSKAKHAVYLQPPCLRLGR
jgi:hypothetical protein